jgi:hypothetical protein
MAAVEGMIEDLRRKGVVIWADGDELRARGKLSANKADLDRLREHKPEILHYLRRTNREPLLRSLDDERFAGVSPDDFTLFLETDRYGDRSPAFDRMIGASDDHAWHPLDKRYLDFDEPFDLEHSAVLDPEVFPCLRAPSVRARLSQEDRVRFVNQVAWLRFSTLLHGEQGALNLSASLCSVLKDQGAQEFAANQTREEARHVTAFARYIERRWGRPAPCLPTLRDFLNEIVLSSDVTKKIIGMQVMVEGLAMGTLASLFRSLEDPVGKRLVQLVMTDEAFHHRFGRLWIDETLPRLVEADRERLQAWTSHCLRSFILKMSPPLELHVLRREFGLDPVVVGLEMQAASDMPIRETSFGTQEIFRVLARALLSAGLLSEDDRTAFLSFVAHDHGETAFHREIVEEGMAYLRTINGEPRIRQRIAPEA